MKIFWDLKKPLRVRLRPYRLRYLFAEPPSTLGTT